MDFSVTSDNKIVCVHDWNVAVLPKYERVAFPLSYIDFMRAKIYGQYTPMSLQNVISYMTLYPDLRIITDTKLGQDVLLKTIAEKYPSFLERFIIQIYEPEQYDTYSSYGFTNIILTLYNLPNTVKADPDQVIALVGDRKLYGLAFPEELAWNEGYVDALLSLDIPLYVHTVNNIDNIKFFRSIGITGVYTDLYLSTNPELKDFS